MIPSSNKPKYKALVRLRSDIWKTLQKKEFKRKKWRSFISFFQRNNRYKKSNHIFINYTSKDVSKFPVYRRYRYQKYLFIRQRIKLIYGSLQDFKIKQECLKSKKQYALGFAQELEQKVITFLYRSKLARSYKEAKLHHKHKRILINGSYKQTKIKKGDVLHFSTMYEKVLKRRIYKNFLKSGAIKYRKGQKVRNLRVKYGIHQCVDFDINSMRFFFHDNIKYFKNHPFKLPYERVLRWYTRV